jgi:hypothetical protein
VSEKNYDTLPGSRSGPVTTVPTPPAPPERPVRVQMGRPIDYWLLWLVALGSLALNVWLVNTLLQIQRQVDSARLELAQGLMQAADGVGTVQLGTVDYTIHVDEEIPLDIAVPISDTLTVPISHTVRVNSSAIVNLPLIGRQAIPFSVNVPVDLEVVIPISRTYEIADTIPILFDVPISIALDETPLGSLKGDVREYLLQLASELAQSPGSAAPTQPPAPPTHTAVPQ